MGDVKEFNAHLVQYVKDLAATDYDRACTLLDTDLPTVQQLTEIKLNLISQSNTCMVRSKIKSVDLDKHHPASHHQELHRLNFLFLSLIRQLAKISPLLANGITGVDNVICERISSMTTNKLLIVAEANGPLFRFAVRSILLRQINLSKGVRAISLIKYGHAIAWDSEYSI